VWCIPPAVDDETERGANRTTGPGLAAAAVAARSRWLLGQDLSVDPRLGELGQDLLGAAAVSQHQLADLAVFGERLQRLGGNRVLSHAFTHDARVVKLASLVVNHLCRRKCHGSFRRQIATALSNC
jgi:hypothetical protein